MIIMIFNDGGNANDVDVDIDGNNFNDHHMHIDVTTHIDGRSLEK